jgi:hypothetical protein
MEVRIGIQNAAREILLESSQSPDEVAAVVAAALEQGTVLELRDERGRLLVVPVPALAYVEIGVEERGRVGFGPL